MRHQLKICPLGQFEMASGKFDLKVAFSSSAASFGKVGTPLTIDPWEPSKSLLRGLALSQSTHRATVAGLGGEVDLFGDKVPLAASGVQLIPGGTNRLQKSQKAFIYGELYAPALTVAGTATVPFGLILPTHELEPGPYTAQITVLDAAGRHAIRRIDFELIP